VRTEAARLKWPAGFLKGVLKLIEAYYGDDGIYAGPFSIDCGPNWAEMQWGAGCDPLDRHQELVDTIHLYWGDPSGKGRKPILDITGGIRDSGRYEGLEPTVEAFRKRHRHDYEDELNGLLKIGSYKGKATAMVRAEQNPNVWLVPATDGGSYPVSPDPDTEALNGMSARRVAAKLFGLHENDRQRLDTQLLRYAEARREAQAAMLDIAHLFHDRRTVKWGEAEKALLDAHNAPPVRRPRGTTRW
jgi:hypothetical protein